jgi:hypothetical protein
MIFARPLWRLATATVLSMVAVGTVTTSAIGAPAQAAPAKPDPKPAAAVGVEASRQAKASGQPVEVTEVTSPVSRTQANPDGTYSTTFSAMPVRMKRGNAWIGLDPELRPNPDGGYSPKASSAQLTIGGGKSKLLATMRNGTERLTMSWPTILPVPTVTGRTATYSNVLPDTDLLVSATEQGGFSHVLTIKTPAAATNSELGSLKLTTSVSTGLTLSAKPSGDLQATDSFDRPLFTAPAPMMWDSSTANGAVRLQARSAADEAPPATPSTPDGPGSAAKTAPVEVKLSGDSLTLTPSQSLLTDKNTKFPIYVDPSWNPSAAGSGVNAWTYISSARPNQNYINGSQFNQDNIARAGYQGWETPYYKASSYFRFGIPSAIHGTRIESATLDITQIWSGNDNYTNLDIKHTCHIDSNTTWNRPPCVGDHIATTWAEPAHGPGQEKIIGFDVKRDIEKAARERWGDTTLGLFNQSEGDKNRWRKFKPDASISIKYNAPPNTPTNAFTSPATPCSGGYIGNTAVTFSALISDPDGSQGQIEAGYTIRDETTNTTIAEPRVTVSSNQYAATKLQIDRFADGHTYTWNVWADDGHDRSGTTTTCRFTVNHKQPAPPTVTSPTYPSTAVGAPARTAGTFTFTPPAGSDTPVSYVYSFNSPPPDTIPAGFGPFRGGTLVPAAANRAPTTVTLTPRRLGPNVLYVYAVNIAGNPGPVTAYTFSTSGLTTPDPAGDFSGDGLPDALVTGTTYRPGLWLHRGLDRDGHVNSATQTGSAGLHFAGSTRTASDWTGATVSATDVDADGTQDLVVKTATGSPSDGNVQIVTGQGDGGHFGPDTAYRVRLPRLDSQPGYQTVDQIVASVTGSVAGIDLPDLYAIIGDTLYLYTPGFPPGEYSAPEPLSEGWANKTITATRSGQNPALFARDNTTGALTLWIGDNNRGIAAGLVDNASPADSSSSATYATSGFNTAQAGTIMGADINGDKKPDLWTTTNTATLKAYVTTGTSMPTPTINPLGNSGLLRSAVGRKCLDLASGSTNNGSMVHLFDCHGDGSTQAWSVPGDGTIRIAGKCLDVAGYQTANGTKVQLWSCTGEAPQQWLMQPNGNLKNPNSGRCLDVPNGNPNSWVQLQIYDCNDGAAQKWTFEYTGIGPIKSGVPNKCLDDQHGGTNNDNPIIIFDCNGSPAQTFTVLDDGTIHAYGHCIDAGGTNNSDKVRLRNCNGTPNQQWTIGPNNSLVNAMSGRCLDNPEGGNINYTQVQIFDCNEGVAQRWILP